ncbi:pre-peptidase C-terminal domain-containing protein [Laspinema sp. A4]|uniref:pre-peptidase C-terminal domain-containing protein n=1 Tax=Laspinema sp. D2d TaxID=2953686 RepID=UPI0021BB9ABA|nr:pre-peptidase C-terminal domain-containing protein [Laspinema sp. D2d]MCT7986359.1 pre-peptidase C-terminal domain-containing protein [Laspinema sp. D2d]
MPVNLADLNFYRAVNPDLAGLNDPQAFQHLLNNGLNEGRVFSPYIDLNLYRAVNTGLAAAGLTSNRQLYDHLQNFGVAEGRSFSSVFDANFYRAANPDLAAAGLNNEQLLDHFRGFGINEGRASAPNFSVSFYLAANPDLQAAGFNFQQALQHYVFAGIREGRTASPGGPVAPPPPPPVTVGDPPPPPNTTFSFARDLGFIPESLEIRDFVGTDNSTDYYRFTVPSNGEFGLTLGAVTETARVELIKDFNQNGEIDRGDGDIIRTGVAGSSGNSNINRPIEAGTYYVRVYPDSSGSNTNYDLRFRFSSKPSTTPANPGNTLNTALDIGVVGTEPRSFRDFVGYTDANDIYLFTVNNNSNLNISLGSLTDTTEIQLIKDFNSNGVIDVGDGDIITRELADGFSNDSINQAVEAGTYYLRVFPFSEDYNTNYDLQLSLQPRSASVNTNSSPTLNLGNDPLINPRSFNTANDSAIQTFTANGNAANDLSGGLGTVTADSIINESFTGGNDFANLLAANPVETPDFSQGLALI